MEIRELAGSDTAADLDAVAALSLRAWAPVFASLEAALGGLFALMHQDWRADQERAVREACATEGMHVWVGVVAGQVAGFVATRLDEAERTGEIYMIAVDPEYQRGGVALALTEHAVAWMRGRGMRLAMVETGGDPGHAPARRTYEKAGFTPLPLVRYFRAL